MPPKKIPPDPDEKRGYDVIERMLDIDPEAMWSDCGLRGSLQENYIISPTVQGGREVSSLDGGYTVNCYGSSKSNVIDAVQVEIFQSPSFI